MNNQSSCRWLHHQRRTCSDDGKIPADNGLRVSPHFGGHLILFIFRLALRPQANSNYDYFTIYSPTSRWNGPSWEFEHRTEHRSDHALLRPVHLFLFIHNLLTIYNDRRSSFLEQLSFVIRIDRCAAGRTFDGQCTLTTSTSQQIIYRFSGKNKQSERAIVFIL